MQQNKIDYVGVMLFLVFFTLLTYAGFLSYKSIDHDVLKRLENTPLTLPTQVPQLSPVPKT